MTSLTRLPRSVEIKDCADAPLVYACARDRGPKSLTLDLKSFLDSQPSYSSTLLPSNTGKVTKSKAQPSICSFNLFVEELRNRLKTSPVVMTSVVTSEYDTPDKRNPALHPPKY